MSRLLHLLLWLVRTWSGGASSNLLLPMWATRADRNPVGQVKGGRELQGPKLFYMPSVITY